MSSEKNINEGAKKLQLLVGSFFCLCGIILLSEGKKIEGWGTLITGILVFYSAVKD
jgi:hypothetical protein